MNDPACCTETCVCRLGYPENRLSIKKEAMMNDSYLDTEAPGRIDFQAAQEWWIKNRSNHDCKWLSIQCVKYHYPGGWPAFIIEVIEK